MGFFDLFREANDDAHGVRLRKHLDDTLMRMAQLDDRVRAIALMRFLEKRKKLTAYIPNMSDRGVLDMGKTLQKEARKQFDLNVAEGYALWLTGTWLESMIRNSDKSKGVHHQLEELAETMSEIDEEDEIESFEGGVNSSFNCFEDWLKVFKKGAGETNPSLKDKDGSSLIDFMDLAPLKRAFSDGVDPYLLGQNFGRDFDFENMGF